MDEMKTFAGQDKRNLTIKDIAEIAGVSYSTVSRCLNDSPLVSDVTKRKINRIAEDLGFEFNASARGLITSKSGTIGIVLPENYNDINVNVYHGMLMNNLRMSLERADLDLIVTFLKNHFTGQNNIKRIITRKKVDGLILLQEGIEPETLEFLQYSNVPYIFTHYPPERTTSQQDVIYTDHAVGGRLVADHLVSIGRKRMGLIGFSRHHEEFAIRSRSFIQHLDHYGTNVDRSHLFLGPGGFETGLQSVLENAETFKKLDALFALNDLIAIGAIKGLTQIGLKVPDDIAVVGYDDTAFSTMVTPSLTTIHQPKEEIATMTCERLLSLIERSRNNEQIPKRRIAIEPELVIRDSA